MNQKYQIKISSCLSSPLYLLVKLEHFMFKNWWQVANQQIKVTIIWFPLWRVQGTLANRMQPIGLTEAFFSRLQNRGVRLWQGVEIFPQHTVFIAQHAVFRC